MSDTIEGGAEFLVKEIAASQIFVPEDFSDEHKQIAETTKQLVENEIIPDIEAMEKHDFELTKKHLLECGELGLLMTDTPEEYGGLELDKVTSMIISEEMACSGAFSVAFTAHTGIGTLPIIYYGTPDQKEKYLEKIITGEWPAAYCLTEPNSGSDALNVFSTATLSEDKKYYILNGTKQFITNGGFAKVLTVFAKIDKEHFTAFIIESDFEGVSRGAEEKKLGIKGSSTCQIIMDDVKVPVENLLGEIGKGHKIAFNILNVGRLKLGAAVNGAGKKAIAEGIKYANDRKQFGAPISSFGAIKEKIANLTAGLFAAESLVFRAAGTLDQALSALDKNVDTYWKDYEGVIAEYSTECAIAKVFCSEVLRDVVDEVLQIHGGYGFTQEYPAERYYRDERINRIFEGTNEINRLLIPGTILKKGLKGELPLQAEAMKAVEALMNPSFDVIDDEIPFAREKALMANVKQIFLILSGAAVQKFFEKLKDEQEILMAAADVVIQIYAMESAILRAEKIHPSLSPEKKALVEAVVKVFTFNGVETLASAAKRGAFYIEEGDTLKMMMSGIRRYTKYEVSGLLEAKRLLADKAIEQESYIF